MTGFSPWLASATPHLLLWLGAICTLGLYSILYKENKIYRLFEHIYLGLATGYLVAINWNEAILPKWWKPIWDQGQWWYIFVLIVALFYYFIYSRKLNWLSRLVIGFFLGVTAGRGFQEFVNDVWPQIPKTFKPVLPHGAVAASGGHPAIPALNVPDALNNLIFMLITLCVMSYFFFSFEQKTKLQRGSAQAGRWLMMFAFGAIFGSTVMARLALLIDRMDYLINDFGPLIGGPVVMFAILIVLAGLIVYLITRPGAKEDMPGEG